jgi:hypothetical protein
LRLLYALAGLFLGFLLFNPYWLISPEKYLDGFNIVSEQMKFSSRTESPINYLWEIQQILTHELILGVLFFISMIYALLKKDKFNLILISTVIPTFLYVGSWDKKGVDYLIVCWPTFILLTTDYLNNYWTKLETRKRIKAGIVFMIVFPLFLFNIYHMVLLILPDTRQDASEWLLSQIEPRDKIYYDKNGYDLGLIDIRRYTEYGVHAKFLNVEIKNRLDPYTDIKRNVNFVMSVEYLVDLSEDSVFMDRDNLYSATRWKNLNEIIEEGVTWIVINEDFKKINMGERAGQPPPSQNNIDIIRSFYSDLQKKLKPLKTFSMNFWRQGPEITIYKIENIR